MKLAILLRRSRANRAAKTTKERVPEVRSLRGGRLLRCQREKLLQDDGVGCDGADESVDVPGGRRRGGPGRRKQRSHRRRLRRARRRLRRARRSPWRQGRSRSLRLSCNRRRHNGGIGRRNAVGRVDLAGFSGRSGPSTVGTAHAVQILAFRTAKRGLPYGAFVSGRSPGCQERLSGKILTDECVLNA